MKETRRISSLIIGFLSLFSTCNFVYASYDTDSCKVIEPVKVNDTLKNILDPLFRGEHSKGFSKKDTIISINNKTDFERLIQQYAEDKQYLLDSIDFEKYTFVYGSCMANDDSYIFESDNMFLCNDGHYIYKPKIREKILKDSDGEYFMIVILIVSYFYFWNIYPKINGNITIER